MIYLFLARGAGNYRPLVFGYSHLFQLTDHPPTRSLIWDTRQSA